MNKSRDSQPAENTKQPLSDWLREMREHVRSQGSYSAQYIRRVLGDPLERVQLTPRGPQPANEKKG
jgi:hypothetical protein